MKKATADFRKFNARAYLEEIHTDGGKGEANTQILRSLIEISKMLPPNATYLELGGGPTIYQLITISSIVTSIVFSEFNEQALDEVNLWVSNNQDAWNWDEWIGWTLFLEKGFAITKDDIRARKKIIRSKIIKTLRCDVRKSNPLLTEVDSKMKFDVIGLNFVLDSITDSIDNWQKYLNNAISLLNTKGLIIYNSISDVSDGWEVGGVRFKGINIFKDQLIEQFKQRGFTNLFYSKLKNSECVGHTSHTFSLWQRS